MLENISYILFTNQVAVFIGTVMKVYKRESN